MADENERVLIEMAAGDRLKLHWQITGQMDKLGYDPSDYNTLNLGIKLPATWPIDEDTQATLSELCVMAVKLDMKIIISNLDMVARTDKRQEDSCSD